MKKFISKAGVPLRGLFLALITLALCFGCPNPNDPAVRLTFTKAIKSYPLGTKVTVETLIKEVILNPAYIVWENIDWKRYEIVVTGKIDTQTPGKKKIDFRLKPKSSRQPSENQLFCYILVLQAGESSPVTPPPVELTGLAFDPDSVTSTGSTLQLTPKFTPPNTNEQELFWQSSDPETATVDDKGLVTRKKPGTVTITAVSCYHPDIKATVSVTFVSTTKSITLSADALTDGRTSKDSVTLTLTRDPADAADVFTFESESPEIATVTQEGKVTRVKPGTVTITAKNADINVEGSLSITFAELAPESVTLSGLESSLNKSYTQCAVCNFEADSNDTTALIQPEAAKQAGLFVTQPASGQNYAKIFFEKTALGDWTYIEFKLKSTANPNIWMRGQNTEEDAATGCAMNPSGGATKWGFGWGAGDTDTNYTANGTFQVMGFLKTENKVYCLKDRAKVSEKDASSGNGSGFLTGLRDKSKFCFATVNDTASFEYVAFYK